MHEFSPTLCQTSKVEMSACSAHHSHDTVDCLQLAAAPRIPSILAPYGAHSARTNQLTHLDGAHAPLLELLAAENGQLQRHVLLERQLQQQSILCLQQGCRMGYGVQEGVQ